MKALRVENRQLSVHDVEKPSRGDEAVVRVKLSGICNTDWEVYRGYTNFQGTLGHEFVGEVESGDGLPAGQRVVGEINAGCGQCPLCLSGDSRHCAERTVLGIVGRDGAHAEFVKLPVRNLLPVPPGVSDEQAVFTEPLAAAYGVIESAGITGNEKVGVIGDGKLGLLCAQVVALTGAKLLLIGKHPEKLEIAERRGIETAPHYWALNHKREFDVVIEASGAPDGIQYALQLLRPRGKLVLKSTFREPIKLDTADIVVNEISIIGSRCGRFEPALELLRTNAVDVESLISEEFSLLDGVRAMMRAVEPGVLKVLLRP